MDTSQAHTVEWSESQKCFHVDTLDRTIFKNIKIFNEPNNCNDWTLVGIFASYEECHEFVRRLKKMRGIE